ncbi:AbrB family transcriptional regulator [Ectobacillus funiculus]|uniref:AbrB family transcriptional regulator n=1 Tax=Ectobacillus funiculus TaxID=137993 RepID=A0ABV5WPI5_9BACI
MKKNPLAMQAGFIIVSGMGGYLLSLTGMSIGWMIGTLAAAGALSFWRPRFLLPGTSTKGIHAYWGYLGQYILGIELGQKVNAAVLQTFQDHWIVIIIMLILSTLFALLSGLILLRFTKESLMTSFLSATPGGLSAMPGIAAELGANMGTVSIVQTTRVLLVVCTIPLFSFYISSDNIVERADQNTISTHLSSTSFLWTQAFLIAAWVGYRAGKLLKLPAPWLVGGMLGVAALQTVLGLYTGENAAAWWPHQGITLAQILLGASVGSRLNKNMFIGAARICIVGLFSSISLVCTTMLCAFLISRWTNISFVTATLALAPGGIAEMATTSLTLHADAAFVVAVQVLRVILILSFLPVLFKLLNKQVAKRMVGEAG